MADVLHSDTNITGGHASAVAAGAAGFLSGADKAKLDGIASGATAASVAGAAAGATALQPGGNLTGQVDGTAVATIKSGAAAGATALQPGGNLTGQVGGTAVATVLSGAAAGATALQPAGNLTGQINSIAVATVTNGAALGATAIQPSTDVVLTSVALGPSPRAGSGMLRVGHATGVSVLVGRDAANSNDVHLIRWHGGGTLEFGEGSANISAVSFSANTQVNFLVGGNDALGFTGMKLTSYIAEWQFRPGLTVNINQDQASSGAGNDFLIKAQMPASANTAGRYLNLEGGQPMGSGQLGGVRLRAHTTTVVEAGGVGGASGLAFFAATLAVKQTVTGSRATGAAYADLLAKLATIGLVTDSSSA